MSSGLLAGPITPGRIAFALGTIGVGALVGGVVADQRDSDIGKGMLYGGLAATAGLSLLYGGSYLWNRFQAGRAGAMAGASQLTTELSHITAPVATTTAATTTARVVTPAAASVTLPAAETLFHASPVLTPALTTTVPAIARTPVLPVASASGGTFVDALRMFIR